MGYAVAGVVLKGILCGVGSFWSPRTFPKASATGPDADVNLDTNRNKEND